MNLPIVAILALAAGVASAEMLTECPPYDPSDTTVHIAHEFDSTKFYRCVMGKKYEMDCDSDNYGNQLYFNPELQVCDYGCQTGQMFDYSLKKCVHAEKAMRKSGSSRMSPIEFETDDPSMFQCPPKGSHETKLIPHECYCNVYFRCQDGDSIREQCPPGQDYDYEKQKCDLRDIVNCRRPILPPTTTTTTTTTTPKPDLVCYPGLRIPHETNCNEFYECAMNGRKQYLRRCQQGYYYDYKKKVCDITSLAECWRGHCVPDELSPHEYDCSKYYKCGPTGTKVLSQSCAEGYLFDCDQKKCVPEQILGRCCTVISLDAFKQEDNKFLEDVL